MPKTIVKKKKSGPVVEATTLHPRVDFIRSIKFAGLGLDRCDARINRIALSAAREAASELKNDVSIKQYVLAHESSYFVVGTDFELVQHADPENRLLVIAATFSAKFDLAKSASEEMVRSFTNLEARLIFFPYLRHFVSDITYRMGIDPLVLPMTSELEQRSPA